MAAPTIDFIIRHIASLQGEDGLFPSVRRNDQLSYIRPDTNVFFTAITVFTLQNLRQKLPPASQSIVDRIIERARMVYPAFRNKDELQTYNFWPTQPSRHFPNGYLLRRFDHFRIPDDIDDTAMVYLTTKPSTADMHWLKDKLSQHANGTHHHQIRNTYPDYRHLRAYSTWFGKNMGVDFDACALANMLYCIYHYNLPRNQHDTDSLYYLRSIVETGRYKSEPFQCAPHYARTSLIIYHIARLRAAFDIPELASIRGQLIADAYQELKQANNKVEQCMLTTALQRLGESPPAISLDGIETDVKIFHFFIAGLLTAYQQSWLRRFADRPIVQMRWQCEAHSWALVGEYLILND